MWLCSLVTITMETVVFKLHWVRPTFVCLGSRHQLSPEWLTEGLKTFSMSAPQVEMNIVCIFIVNYFIHWFYWPSHCGWLRQSAVQKQTESWSINLDTVSKIEHNCCETTDLKSCLSSSCFTEGSCLLHVKHNLIHLSICQASLCPLLSPCPWGSFSAVWPSPFSAPVAPPAGKHHGSSPFPPCSGGNTKCDSVWLLS